MRAFLLSLQWSLTLCDPVDCSPPDSSVHGILQTRILEWISMPSSRGVFRTQQSNPGVLWLLHWRQILYHWATGEALFRNTYFKFSLLCQIIVKLVNIHVLVLNMKQLHWLLPQLFHFVNLIDLSCCCCCLVTESCPVLCVPGDPVIKDPPANTRNVGSIPESQRYPRERNGNPRQSSCLGNPMERGAWWATDF